MATTRECEDCAGVVAMMRAAALDSKRWPDALDAIARHLDARFAALIFEDRVSALLELKHSTRAEKAWIVEYLRNYRKLDPVKARALAEIGVGEAFSSRDFLSPEKFRRSGAFERWMAPHGLVDVIGAVLHRSETGVCMFVAFRDAHAGEVDAAAKARLNALLPHLAEAIVGAPPPRDAGTALADLFEHLAAPVLVVDAGMRVMYANRSGDDMLAEGDALSVLGGALIVRDARAKETLERTLRLGGARGSAEADTLAIMLRRGQARCCVMHVLRLSGGKAALFVRRLALDQFEGGGVASGLYGLTARESSVLLAIAEIGGVPATARALGLSEGTVKGYLKSIFQKTGATRQADLVKLVLALESPFRTPARDSVPA